MGESLPVKLSSAFRKQKDDGRMDGERGSLDWNGCIPGSWVPSFWACCVSLKRAHKHPIGGRVMGQ